MMVLFVSDDMAGTRQACEEWLAARLRRPAHGDLHCAGAHATDGAPRWH
jgi:hypothetical protein